MSEWERAAALPFEGGLAARTLLSRYLEGGVDAVVPFNGPAAIVILDPRDRIVHAITDQFGYHPLFGVSLDGDGLDGKGLTTFPDLVLCDPEADSRPDHVSMAEFLRAWRATPPHTYFEAVRHVGAASVTTISLDSGKATTRTYWDPLEHEPFANVGEAAEALASAIKDGMAERTAIAERPLFFVSGGADSRVLLYAADDPARVTGVNLYERPGVETDVARALTEAAGSRFLALQRSPEFYAENLSRNVRWSGGMWCAEDAHYLGFEPELAVHRPDLVMTACTTDWVFKGYGLEKTYRRIGGKPLPIYRFTDRREEGFLPNRPTAAPAALEAEVRARHDAWFSDLPDVLASDRDRRRVEDRRVRPTCYTVSVSGQIMPRTMPYDTFLADSRVAAVYARTRAAWTLNGELWGKAAARVCEKAGPMVDANFGWPVDAGVPARFAYFVAGSLKRKLLPREVAAVADDGRSPSSGSWPSMGWYAANSKVLGEFWSNASPDHRERLRHLAGEDPFDRPLSAWAGDGQRMMRMATLLAHWRESEARRTRAVDASE